MAKTLGLWALLWGLLVSVPALASPYPFYLKFEGKLVGSPETFEGRVHGDGRPWNDVWLWTSNGTRCVGTLTSRRQTDGDDDPGRAVGPSHTYLLCTDGRQGALEVRTQGRNSVWRGDLGGIEFILAFPDHPQMQSRLGPSEFKPSPLPTMEPHASSHRPWRVPRR